MEDHVRSIRTDLALEARQLWREQTEDTAELPGVRARETERRGFQVTTVSVLDAEGEKALCKPKGEYVTLELDKLLRREENAFADCAAVLAEILRSLLGDGARRFLVVGLGNETITPDAIGPWTLESLLVTRHLKEQGYAEFENFSSVSALRCGVLGTTGLEAARLAALAAGEVKPDAVIAVDALASRDPDRLCRTVQISDTGIVPGSGVGNSRSELSRRTLGVPVIAIGVPTVVDAATLAADLARKAGVELAPEAIPATGMMVTPRDIDRGAHDAAKLVGYALDLALHPGLTVEDIDMLL